MAGLAAARARGRLGGRPRRLTPEQVKMASHLMQDPDVRSRRYARPWGWRGRRSTATSGQAVRPESLCTSVDELPCGVLGVALYNAVQARCEPSYIIPF